MSQLGDNAYNTGSPLLTYKNTVKIPSLGMIDDILSITKCGQESIISNSVTNNFVESKRLELSEKKCKRIHIGKRKLNEKCAELKVHDNLMKDTDSEKYIGDIVNKSGKIEENVISSQNKGYGIVSDILAILEEIPFGKHRVEAGLCMSCLLYTSPSPRDS